MAFLKRENLQVLWDVITEDDFVRGRPRQELQRINKMFNDNVERFHQQNKNKTNLVELNKNFISLMMRTIDQMQQQKVLYTSEEIANEKKNKFDVQLKERQDAFHDSMTQHVPTEPNFKDPHDGPITNLDVEMKKLMAMRNYEVQSYSGNDPSNWLQPVETSVKAEKLSRQPTSLQNPSQGRNTIHIGSELNEDKNEVIDLETFPKKSVAWSEDLESITPNFFSKLKKTLPQPLEVKTDGGEKITFELKEDVPEEVSLKDSEHDELKREINNLHKKLDLILNHLSRQSPTPSTPSLSRQTPEPLALSELLF